MADPQNSAETTAGDMVPTGASELDEVVAAAEREGFAADFDVAEDDPTNPIDGVRCPSCGRTSPAAEFHRAWSRRLEGASDPADMVHVSALTCPSCRTAGVLITPFGSAASERQAAVLQGLPPADELSATDGA